MRDGRRAGPCGSERERSEDERGTDALRRGPSGSTRRAMRSAQRMSAMRSANRPASTSATTPMTSQADFVA